MQGQIDALEGRVRKLEEWKGEQHTVTALMHQNMERTDERFDKLEKGIARVLWTVGVAIIAGVVNWLLNGGLNVGP